MQTSTIILSLLLATALATEKPSFASDAAIQKDLDFEKNALDSVSENNCGELHFKTLILKSSRILQEQKEFEEMNKVFSILTDKSECRAIVSGEQIWVRITSSHNGRECQLYVPYNAINLFSPDNDKYPHIAIDMFLNTFGSYSRCYDIESKDNKDKLDVAEEEVLIMGYLTNIMRGEDVEDIPNISDSDKEAIVNEIENSDSVIETVEEIEGLSQNGQEALKEYIIDNIPENVTNKIIKQPQFINEVNKLVESHPELAANRSKYHQTNNKEHVLDLDEEVLDEDLLPNLFNDEKEENAHTANKDKKYLNPLQINESATYCDDAQIKRVISLHNAMATGREMKPIQIYTQNVKECIVGHDNGQFKAVLHFNENPCLFDIVLDKKMNKATLIESTGISLTACHKKALFM